MYIRGLECSLEDGDCVVLSGDIVQGLGTANWRLSSVGGRARYVA